MVNSFKLVTAEEVDPFSLDRFLRGYFSAEKCDFLYKHGLWRHRTNKNRLVVLDLNNQIVGYCSSIPVKIWLENSEVPALFWVDNYVAPEWRGKKIQSLTDQAIRNTKIINLGFPNKLSAPIHKKHGWDLRDDYYVLMMPLFPKKIVALQALLGRKTKILPWLSCILEYPTKIWRMHLRNLSVDRVNIIKNPDPEYFEGIFKRFRRKWVTVNRSADYLYWRYLNSPFRDQYSYYIGGTKYKNSIVVICRTFCRRGVKVVRILDLFGNLEDKTGIIEVIKYVSKNAVIEKAAQLTAMVSNKNLEAIFKSIGYVVKVKSRFRCFCRDVEKMNIIREKKCHWVLGDSDNDSID